MIQVQELRLRGLKLIETRLFHDERGFFMERFNEARFREAGLPDRFVQVNHSRSLPRVVRGLHLQRNPSQGKLVGVIRGRIWDVAVDVRPDSPTFKQHVSVELDGGSGRLFWLPAGFAHGFCVLGEEPADVVYQVDDYYHPAGEIGIRWNDPELRIPWPVADAILAERDRKLPLFEDVRGRLG